MSAFRVGQRVRIIRTMAVTDGPNCLGRKATIWDIRSHSRFTDGTTGTSYRLDIDGIGRYSSNGNPWGCPADWIAPLTDPRCSDFIGDMERFASLAKKHVLTPDELAKVTGGIS